MRLMTAATAALLCAVIGSAGAMAQTTPPTAIGPSATTPSASTSTDATYSGQQSADEWRSSKVVGMNVDNAANEKVGDINDIILGRDGKAEHAIVGVGGLLGINEKNVAVPYADLQFRRENDGSLRVMIDSTKEALQSAPNYEFYDGRG